MIILQGKDISVSFGEKTIFSDVNFAVDENDKIGLAGVNGAGKTTLFKMLSGIEPEDFTGQVIKQSGLTVGFMEQHVLRNDEISVKEEALSVFAELAREEKRLEELHERIDTGETDDAILDEQMRLFECFQSEGGLTFRARTESMLAGMGFAKEDQDKPVKVLSGGERSRLQLSKLLLSGAKLLLLDEPTNHLDFYSSEWLENFLGEFKGAYIVVSHDRYFLDKVTSKTFALENGTLTCFKGNYSEYLRQYDERAAFLAKKYAQDTEEIRRIEGIIEQQKRFGQEHNYITIRSKEKQIERIKRELIPPPPPRRSIKFAFPCKAAHGTDVISAEGLFCKMNGEFLFRNVDLDVKFGERVFILGANGCGKSTLMKMLTGKPHGGESGGRIRTAEWLKTGCFEQMQENRLTSRKNLMDFVWDDFPKLTKTQVYSGLALFGLYGDDLLKRVSDLSGGEAAKTVLLKLMLDGPNLLMLDEPTNHLDIDARDALNAALADYKGTMIVISHDRTMINALATKLIFLKPDGAEIFDGNYDEWRELQLRERNEPLNEQKTASAKTNPYREQKELRSRQRKAKNRVERLENEIEAAEKRIGRLNEEISLAASDYEKLTELGESLSECEQELTTLMDEWEKAMAEIDE